MLALCPYVMSASPLDTAHSRFLDLIRTEFHICNCVSLPQILIRNGLFPTAPFLPRMAVSIDLLDLYSALFDRSADADTPRVGLEREGLGEHTTQTTHHPRGSERMQGSPILEHDRLRPIPNGAGSVLFDSEGFESDSMDFVGERRRFR